MSDYVPKNKFKCLEENCNETFDRVSVLNRHIGVCQMKKESKLACFRQLEKERAQPEVAVAVEDYGGDGFAYDEDDEEGESTESNESSFVNKKKNKKVAKRVVKKMRGEIRRAERKEQRRAERREFKKLLKGKNKHVSVESD